MNRRDTVLALLALGTVGRPLNSLAQPQGKVWRVGFLALPSRANALDPLFFGAFPLGMRDLGYIEGKNLVIEWRFADGDGKRLPGLAAELVTMKVDVLVAAATDAALAAQAATTTVPIVMTTANDPVAGGLVKSMARPAGNVTGLANLSGDLGPKRLEMLLAVVPTLSRVAVLYSPTSPGTIKNVESLQAAGKRLGVTILPAIVGTAQEIDTAFVQMRKHDAGALIVFLQPLLQQQRNQIATLAAKYRLPAMTPDQMYAEAGCLMSYGTNIASLFRHAATYVDKILKGANPGDLPVEQPTKFDLVINRKTEKALGLTIPQSLLISADRVIE